jgi:methylated-DNA-[protein]-cysteine S-methyltransferase
VSSLTVESPVGPLTVIAEADAIVSLWFVVSDRPGAATQLLRKAQRQLKEYFAGKRREFDLPLAPQGTSFQRRVWEALRRIPYGEQRSYGEIAKALRSSPRAVGQACGQNPIPILIPCHRVVGGQSLGGYSGGRGIATKKRLLDLERIDLFSALPTP